jgi:hypothetical protein
MTKVTIIAKGGIQVIGGRTFVNVLDFECFLSFKLKADFSQILMKSHRGNP